MVTFYKAIIPICRSFNLITLALGLCLYGVAASIHANVGAPLVSLVIGDIFCGTVTAVTAATQCITLTRRSTTAFKISKSVGFVNTLIWFTVATAHYVTRNFKILEPKRRVEFQNLMNITLYGCLLACIAQMLACFTVSLITCTGGYDDDIESEELTLDELSNQSSLNETNAWRTPKEQV